MNNQSASVTNIKLPLWRRIGYGFTDAGANFSFVIVSSYLSTFYTDVVGLGPAAVSLIMLIARIWDAFNDPMMGIIAQKTKSRWGKYRPYLLFGAPILSITYILCFTKPSGLSGSALAIYCGFTYILCGMAYTVVSIAGTSLVNVLTSNNQERMVLISFRTAISSVASLISSAAVMPLILYFGKGVATSTEGYLGAVIVFAIAGLICYWIAFAGTKEVIQEEATAEKVPFFESVKLAFQEHDIRCILIGDLIYLCGVFARIGIMLYFFLYVVENPLWISAAGVALSLSKMLPTLILPYLTKRFEKKNIIIGFFVLGFLGGCILFLGGNMVNLPLICIGTALFHGGGSTAGTVGYGLIAETVDAMEVRTGQRADAIIMSIASFAVKLGSAIAGIVGVPVLFAVGYVANATQTAGTKLAMNAVINLAPSLLFLLAIIPFAMVKMNRATAEKNTKILEERMKEQK